MTTTPDGSAARRLRRDAERNRERILVAAREVFAARGLAVGLNDIAHHAGVGVGTIYRRYPDKQALIVDALTGAVADMLDVAAVVGASERAWDGLVLYLEKAADLLAANLGLRDLALVADQPPGPLQNLKDRIGGEIDRLLRAAQEQGDVRPEITVADLGVVLWMVSELAEHGVVVRPGVHRRYLRLLLDGMRTDGAHSELGPPLVPADMDAIVRHWADRR